MYTKTMEGLVGASMNMKLLNTPFRVYKEAERRGDTVSISESGTSCKYFCFYKEAVIGKERK